jgi:hypothetical protein
MPALALIDMLDRVDLLTPYKGRSYEYHCPSCNGKLSISRTDGTKFTCWDGCARADIRRAILSIAGESRTPDRELVERQAQRRDRQEDLERIRRAALMPEISRDREWRKILTQSTLSDRHRQDMLNRGWSDRAIDASGARSLGCGRVIPIRNAHGLMVGAQVIKSDQKHWYGVSGTNQLRETGELPLSVVYPHCIARAGYLLHTESVCDKPHLAAANFRTVTIGSSNPGSQPIDLARSVATIRDRLGWHPHTTIVHIIVPDGGSAANFGVLNNYFNLASQLESLGGCVRFAWWGQLCKHNGDIDEIPTHTPIELLSPAAFASVCRSHLTQSAIAIGSPCTLALQYSLDLFSSIC